MFVKALPIWIGNKESEMNIQARFVAEFIGAKETMLKITGATFYKVFLNGNLIHYGPAPTAKGYARVDVLKLNPTLGEKNVITIEAAGYNCFSYACIKQTSYVQAEIICDEKCAVATGYDFEGYRVLSRIQKVLRYSFQRQFSEVWDLHLQDTKETINVLDLNLKYLKRKAPLPEPDSLTIKNVYATGKFTYDNKDIAVPSLQGATDADNTVIDNFPLSEIDKKPIKAFMDMNYTITPNATSLPCELSKGEYAVFEHGKVTTGLMNFKYAASDDCKIIIAFDEKLIDGRFLCEDWEMFNVIEVASSGQIDFTNFEVYSFKYFAVYVIEGDLKIEEVNIEEIKNPLRNVPKLNCDDEEILKIYEAGCESARCNSLGIFMDCPSRERAGWLCDSYFAAKAAYELSRNTDVEDDFIENFLLFDGEYLPDGMLPMCYPSDHPNGIYIPQWAMWFILQLDDYKNRNTDVSVSEYKETAYNLLNYFGNYENEYGLLENLGGWNFVEWSEANQWTSGINFPTNMLYSEILEIVGNWYDDKCLLDKSKALRKRIREMSYDGKFFRDQALRREHNIPVCENHISEVCQYYAFKFHTADDETFRELRDTLVTEFKPGNGNYAQIEKVNAFMGMYLRMELLLEWGYKDQLIGEIKDFFGHMSEITGTLWEHKTMTNSLNHGFPAYIIVLLQKIFN